MKAASLCREVSKMCLNPATLDNTVARPTAETLTDWSRLLFPTGIILNMSFLCLTCKISAGYEGQAIIQYLKFCRRFVALVGDNGIGKSTLVAAAGCPNPSRQCHGQRTACPRPGHISLLQNPPINSSPTGG
jgi:hypothetical protein